MSIKKADEKETRVNSVPGLGYRITKPLRKWFSALLLVGLGSAMVLYLVNNNPELFGLKTANDLKQPDLQEETSVLVNEVGKIIKLPEGEIPTLATVTELELVKDKPFFINAQNGDRLLIYKNAKRAYLYRPSEKRIIEVGGVSTNEVPEVSFAQPKPTLSNSPTPKIFSFVLYNGTEEAGLIKTYESDFKLKVVNSQVIDRVAAGKNDYEKTLIVDLTGERGDIAHNLAKELGIEVSDLPDGENKPLGADFLIIIGKDNKVGSNTSN